MQGQRLSGIANNKLSYCLFRTYLIIVNFEKSEGHTEFL